MLLAIHHRYLTATVAATVIILGGCGKEGEVNGSTGDETGQETGSSTGSETNTRPAFERRLHPFSFLIRREFKKEHIVIAHMGQKAAALDVIRMISVLH